MQQETGTDSQPQPIMAAATTTPDESSTQKSAAQSTPPSRRRALLIATAVALPVTVILAFVLAPDSDSENPAATSKTETVSPLTVDAPANTAITDKNCPKVVDKLPVTLANQESRPVDSFSPLVAAWGNDPAIVFRCGVPRPANFKADSGTLQINDVQWFAEPGKDSTKWTVVDRPVYIEVTVPQKYSSSPIIEISEQVKELPSQPLDPNK